MPAVNVSAVWIFTVPVLKAPDHMFIYISVLKRTGAHFGRLINIAKQYTPQNINLTEELKIFMPFWSLIVHYCVHKNLPVLNVQWQLKLRAVCDCTLLCPV
jgi:hypothetical protein